MSNTETPAGNPGGGTTTPTPSGSEPAASMPDRLRVHALARLLSVSSREVLSALAELGVPARSVQSVIDRDTALRAVEVLLPTPVALDADQPVAAVPQDSEDREAVEDPGAPAVPLAPLFAAPSPPPPLAPSRLPVDEGADATVAGQEAVDDDEDRDETEGTARRRRRRGRRGRGRGRGGQDGDDPVAEDDSEGEDISDVADEAGSAEDVGGDEEDSGEAPGTTRRRRRRRRRKSGGDDENLREDDPPNTVLHVREAVREGREPRSGDDEVRSVRGSTRLEAKRQRRRDGREAGRRRTPVLSESEFLARRESVERVMVVRERAERTEIAVLEDGVLVEHFVTSSGSGSMVGNVYLGRVQNVLPSMEAAFVDIGRGRNAVLYAGEVDWDAAGLEGKARKIEQALSSGDSVLVQVTKDPVGHKGARLTTQLSLPGRFLVYVPDGGTTGISRKLPDTERRRLKDILKRIVPEDSGVIIRTASEGISEDELGRDVRRLQAQWEVIREKAQSGRVKAPVLLYEEPDLLIKVVRDLFTEDFSELVVQGDDAWDTIEAYVAHVAPDLVPRLQRSTTSTDVFTEFRIDEQITKALDRKVWLPSGGYLILDRTEAMTVIDVNTGKFTGSGGNLEETVTRNNLEAAEEIVRQLRLRDIGGIIVIDFIDMVLESNRDLVLRRLTECLGRDRTRHQVAEVTSLGLVQMTRKRVGTGLVEAYSTPCEHCRGRGVVVSSEPVVDSRGGGPQGAARRSPATMVEQTMAEPPTATEPVTSDQAGSRPATLPVASTLGSTAPVSSVPAPTLPAPAETGPQPPTPQPAAEPVGQAPTAPEPTAAPPAPDALAHTTPGAAAPAVPQQAAAEQDQVRPRRRRRAASRPAGPPASESRQGEQPGAQTVSHAG